MIKKILILTAAMLCSASLFGEGTFGNLDIVNATTSTIVVNIGNFPGKDFQEVPIKAGETYTVKNVGLIPGISRDCWVQWRYITRVLKSPGELKMKPDGKYDVVEWDGWTRKPSTNLEANASYPK